MPIVKYASGDNDSAWRDLALLPLHLFEELQSGMLKPASGGRVQFTVTGEIDVRLLHRYYRAWWARVWVPMQAGMRLTQLSQLELKMKRQGRSFTFASFEKLAIRCGPAFTFNRLKKEFLEEARFMPVTDLSLAKLEEWGSVPREWQTLISKIALTYQLNPNLYPHLPWTLEDTYLPEFIASGPMPSAPLHIHQLLEHQSEGIREKMIVQRRQARLRSRTKSVANPQP